MFRPSRARNKRLLRLLGTASLAFGVSGCKLITDKGKISAFSAESRGHFEYLVEKIVTVDNPTSSGYMPTGNPGALDRSAPGSAQMFSQSLDSIGVCYWYAKFPKSSGLDRGLALDFPDGTPNMGVRNNIIARAGVPLTANAISMGEVLLSMREAGGELAALEQRVSEGTVKLHEVLWNSAAAAGVTGSALAAARTSRASEMISNSKAATWQLMTRLSGAQTLASGNLSGATGRPVPTRVLHASHPDLRNLASAYGNGWQSLMNDPNAMFEVGTQTVGQKGSRQAVTVVVGNGGTDVFFRATNPNDAKKSASYAFRRASKANQTALKSMGFTDDLLSGSRLAATMNKVRQLGLRSVMAGRAVSRTVGTSANKVAGKVVSSSAKGATNLLNRCRGSAKRVAICGAIVGTVYAGTNLAMSAAGQAQVAANEEQMAARMDTILSNPQTQQNFAAVTAELEKHTKISPELMESFRKILAIKSARSRLGSCSQIFGTELLTTPGVEESGYDPDRPSLPNVDFASFEIPSAPGVDESALEGIPDFIEPEDGDLSDISTAGGLGSEKSIPSADLFGTEGDSGAGSDSGFGTQTNSGSDEFGPSGN